MTAGRRRALVTGVTGQDGSFLAEQLLGRGYEVIGVTRRRRNPDLGLVEHLRDRLGLIEGDLLAPETLQAAVAETRPDELYHLAAPTFVPDSWQAPAQTVQAIGAATASLLEALVEHSPDTRLFVAASGEMFGDAPASPQQEDTPCRPRTPYATAKLAAHQLVGQFRGHAGLFACSGILYNHESERRPQRFVTRKITHAAAQIKLGLANELTLGDTSATRDWSFAGDITHAAWLTLQADRPDDYVLASGVGHTVADLLRTAFGHVGLDPCDHVRTDPALVRAPEAVAPIGDPAKARRQLDWQPTLGFEELVARMVDADLQRLSS